MHSPAVKFANTTDKRVRAFKNLKMNHRKVTLGSNIKRLFGKKTNHVTMM